MLFNGIVVHSEMIFRDHGPFFRSRTSVKGFPFHGIKSLASTHWLNFNKTGIIFRNTWPGWLTIIKPSKLPSSAKSGHCVLRFDRQGEWSLYTQFSVRTLLQRLIGTPAAYDFFHWSLHVLIHICVPKPGKIVNEERKGPILLLGHDLQYRFRRPVDSAR